MCFRVHKHVQTRDDDGGRQMSALVSPLFLHLE